MKLVSGWFSGIVTAALGGLLVVMATPALQRYFSPDRLTMDIYPTSWSAIEASQLNPQLESRLGPYVTNQMKDGGGISVAKIVIRNTGAKKVEHIKIGFGDHKEKYVAIYEGGKKVDEKSDVIEVSLLPIEPGGVRILSVWSIYDMLHPYHYEGWNTYSSEGEISMRLFAPESRPIFGWIVYKGLWELGVPLLVIIGFGGFIVMWACLIYVGRYFKDIITDEDFYLAEKIRYEQDPQKFVVKAKPHP